jgi:hypothetical protein
MAKLYPGVLIRGSDLEEYADTAEALSCISKPPSNPSLPRDGFSGLAQSRFFEAQRLILIIHFSSSVPLSPCAVSLR